MENKHRLVPIVYAHITNNGFIRMWSKTKTNLDAVTDSIGVSPVGLVTVDQAEEYAKKLYDDANGWKPIATAPKNKTIDLWHEDFGRIASTCFFDTPEGGVWIDDNGFDYKDGVTHWAPLNSGPHTGADHE